jgi:hypothetical protein
MCDSTEEYKFRTIPHRGMWSDLIIEGVEDSPFMERSRTLVQ